MSAEQTSSAEQTPPDWFLLQSKPRQAERAQRNLEQQGYQVYLPCITVERVRRRRRYQVQEPLFPNYLFIRLQRWVDNWYPLRSTRGVARLVAFGAEPLAVDDQLIEAIAARAEALAQPSALEPGQRVEILDGPFAGLSAIFKASQGERRVQLLIELLHREVTATLPRDQVRLSA
ncbi:transcription/translation regulatory transformer protein RfaH [Thiohalocapsa marina]|uniref:Transcription antitermination protein RfaH n=1 Tax=Thiohalocapsa marina TaxID=424902 RepID=A0A5M8FFN0_9GAMM|nr:transcription/translation regulatory transformer protein RfaH [Thiohalocapsa marina]KAA6181851.1 transcription/translation regulatory transformer protein RfaH [Thiohalocapsa marina]